MVLEGWQEDSHTSVVELVRPQERSVSSGMQASLEGSREEGPLELEDWILQEQARWIEDKFGEEVAGLANYGWAVDDVAGAYATKVYGHGVLSTSMESPYRMEFYEW